MTENEPETVDEYEGSKYVVIKGSDIHKIRTGLWEMVLEDVFPVDDAVVIRRQDVFAPPALDAYANSISVALEIARSHDLDLVGLKAIADYFSEQASISWDTDRKLPD